MAMTLAQLTKSLNTDTYTPMTEEEMAAQAAAKYASAYDAQRLATQQTYDTSALALSQQRSALDTSYAKQIETAQDATAQSLSSADKYSLQRGMQRSSYNAANLSNIQLAGNESVNEIAAALTEAQGNIDAQTTLLTQQLAQQLAQYDTSEQTDIQAYIEDLRQQEYERTTAAEQYANEVLMALYEYGKSSGSGSSSRSSSSSGSSSTSSTPSASSDASSASSGTNLSSTLSNAVKSSASPLNAAQLTRLLSLTTSGKAAKSNYVSQTATDPKTGKKITYFTNVGTTK